MLDKFNLFGTSVFILSAFVFSAFAQTPESEFSTADFKKNSFSKNRYETLVRESPPDEPTDWKLARGAKHLNVELGYSPFAPTNFNGREYDTRGRRFMLASFRWGRVIGTAKGVTYEYQIEATPLALAIKNEVRNPAFQSAAATPLVPPTVRETTYGFGIAPAGFRFLFLPKKRLKPFIALHAGFIFFKKPVPVPDSLSYDFTGDFGGGLQYQIKRNKALSFGYRYYHISNMNIGAVNPGYNAQVFYIGYSFFYK